jgi:hypothetical protein
VGIFQPGKGNMIFAAMHKMAISPAENLFEQWGVHENQYMWI